MKKLLLGLLLSVNAFGGLTHLTSEHVRTLQHTVANYKVAYENGITASTDYIVQQYKNILEYSVNVYKVQAAQANASVTELRAYFKQVTAGLDKSIDLAHQPQALQRKIADLKKLEKQVYGLSLKDKVIALSDKTARAAITATYYTTAYPVGHAINLAISAPSLVLLGAAKAVEKTADGASAISSWTTSKIGAAYNWLTKPTSKTVAPVATVTVKPAAATSSWFSRNWGKLTVSATALGITALGFASYNPNK